MAQTEAHRYHDISCGHRVVGHENKCRWLHGHNYRIHFHCQAATLDSIGRVVDFGVIKSTMCEWLERNWDHKFLMWEQDPLVGDILGIVDGGDAEGSVLLVPFNPTAENMAEYLLNQVGPEKMPPSIVLTKVVVEETRKCSATASLPAGGRIS